MLCFAWPWPWPWLWPWLRWRLVSSLPFFSPRSTLPSLPVFPLLSLHFDDGLLVECIGRLLSHNLVALALKTALRMACGGDAKERGGEGSTEVIFFLLHIAP